MKFEINSMFDVGDTVMYRGYRKAKVVDVDYDDVIHKILYLLDFSNRERKWVNEIDCYSARGGNEK